MCLSAPKTDIKEELFLILKIKGKVFLFRY